MPVFVFAQGSRSRLLSSRLVSFHRRTVEGLTGGVLGRARPGTPPVRIAIPSPPNEEVESCRHRERACAASSGSLQEHVHHGPQICRTSRVQAGCPAGSIATHLRPSISATEPGTSRAPVRASGTPARMTRGRADRLRTRTERSVEGDPGRECDELRRRHGQKVPAGVTPVAHNRASRPTRIRRLSGSPRVMDLASSSVIEPDGRVRSRDPEPMSVPET